MLCPCLRWRLVIMAAVVVQCVANVNAAKCMQDAGGAAPTNATTGDEVTFASECPGVTAVVPPAAQATGPTSTGGALKIVSPVDGDALSGRGCATVTVATDSWPPGTDICLLFLVPGSATITGKICAPYDGGGGSWRIGVQWSATLAPAAALEGGMVEVSAVAAVSYRMLMEFIPHTIRVFVNVSRSDPCGSRGGGPGAHHHGEQRRRVVDAFPFFDEADLLLVRLRELYDVVDRFVVCESTMTHMGAVNPAPRLNLSSPAFSPFSAKLLHVVVTPIGDEQWSREHNVRNQCGDVAVRLHGFGPADLVIHSDVDEIPRARTISALRFCGDKIFPAQLEFTLSRHVPGWRAEGAWRGASVALMSQHAGPHARPGAVPMHAFRACRECGAQPSLYRPAPSGWVQVSGCTIPAAADMPLHLVLDAGWHLTTYRPPQDIHTKMRAFAHGDEAAYAGWGQAHSCWAVLFPAHAPYNVGSRDRMQFVGGGVNSVPDMPESWWDFDGVNITRHTLAAAVDAMLGVPPVASNFELLGEPPEHLVPAVCGPRPSEFASPAAAAAEAVAAADVEPLDAAAGAAASGTSSQTHTPQAHVALGGLAHVFVEAGFAQLAATPHGLGVALLVSVTVDEGSCGLLLHVIAAVQAAAGVRAAANGGYRDGEYDDVHVQHLPDGWRSRLLLLPMTGRGGAASTASDSEAAAALAGCAAVLRGSDPAVGHVVRVSQRVAAAARSPALSTTTTGARIASVVDDVFRLDVVPASLGAIIVLVADGLEECRQPLPPSSLRGLRSGGNLIVVSGTGGEAAARNVLTCLIGEKSSLFDCRIAPWSSDTGPVSAVAFVCAPRTPAVDE
jgi:hypothetical protein